MFYKIDHRKFPNKCFWSFCKKKEKKLEKKLIFYFERLEIFWVSVEKFYFSFCTVDRLTSKVCRSIR